MIELIVAECCAELGSHSIFGYFAKANVKLKEQDYGPKTLASDFRKPQLPFVDDI